MVVLDISIQSRVIIGISAMLVLFTSFLVVFIYNQRKKLQYHKELQAMHDERQKLLSDQNVMLEQRVMERTAELSEQKEVLQKTLQELKASQSQLIQKEKEAFLAKYGTKLTITSFAARATAKALKDYPFLNSSLEDDTIVVKKFVNIGIAVSIDQGIMVPVVKNCEELSLAEIAKAVGDVSAKARSNQLSPSDVQDGTITLTNFGISGVMMGVPIIRYPEVAILGLGAIQRKVVALEDDTMAIRSVMHVSLTFDHRVIDGMYGCGFLNSLKEHLEQDAAL